MRSLYGSWSSKSGGEGAKGPGAYGLVEVEVDCRRRWLLDRVGSREDCVHSSIHICWLQVELEWDSKLGL